MLHRAFLLLVLTIISTCSAVAHNGETIDSLLRHRMAENGLSIYTITIQYKGSEKVHIHEKKGIDAEGRITHWFLPKGGSSQRRLTTYDAEGRIATYTSFSSQDTSVVSFKHIYTYTDSVSYHKKCFNHKGELTSTFYYHTYTRGNKTHLAEREEKHLYDKTELSETRFYAVGDSLFITQYVDFDKEGKVADITSYYDLTQRTDTGAVLKTSGQYQLSYDLFDEDNPNAISPEDFYSDPQGFYERQLADEFSYELGDSHTYEIYNAKGLLIQDGYGIYKKTFTYNAKGELTEVVNWDRKSPFKNEGLIPAIVSTYEYDSRGLPIKLTEAYADGSEPTIYLFSYE